MSSVVLDLTCMQFNSDDHPPLNKFISIQAMPSTAFRSTFSPSSHGHRSALGNATASNESGTSTSGGAFGSFGIGNIGGGTNWRGKRA